jgi:hypothetical protein
MKQAILTLLTRLTNAMKAESRSFHVSFLPIVQSAIEPDSDTQIYLLEDALDLWSSIIAQTPSAPEPTPPELLNLLQYLIPLFSMDNETLRKGIEITEAYLLLAPAAVLADNFRPAILQALADLLGTLKPEANGIMTHLVQCVIRGAEGVGGEQAVKVLTSDLISSGFLAKVLEGLHGAWTHHQSHGPYRELPSRAVDGVVETDYFTVLARIGLASPAVLLEALASVGNAELEKTLDWLLEEWFSHIENIGDGPNKKLMTLVLTRLLETEQPWAFARLQNFFVAWTDVLAELLDGMDDRSAEYVPYPLPLPPPPPPKTTLPYPDNNQANNHPQRPLLAPRAQRLCALGARSPRGHAQARAHLLGPRAPAESRRVCARAPAGGCAERGRRGAVPRGVACARRQGCRQGIWRAGYHVARGMGEKERRERERERKGNG